MPKKLFRALAAILVLLVLGIGYGAYTGDWQKGFAVITSGLSLDQSDPIPSVSPTPVTVPTTTTVTAATSTSVIQTNALVKRVVDGDTVIVELDGQGEFTVRLLGINTPETVDPRRPVECFGKQASQRAKDMLSGQRVRLDPDPQADERDKYGRILRKLVMENGKLFNADMVAEGYAFAYTTFPMDASYKRELKKLEEEARLAKRGLWDPTVCPSTK